MKAQNKNADLLLENIKILQNELAKKNEIIKPLIEIQSKLFDSLPARRNDQTISDQQQPQEQTQQQLEHNRQLVYEQQQHQYKQQIQQNQHTQNIQLPQQQQQQQNYCR